MKTVYAVVSEDNYETDFPTLGAALEHAAEEKGTVTIWKRVGKLKNKKRNEKEK